MLRAGLTGAAGSGKSTVARLLAGHGLPVVDADRAAHELYAPGTDLAETIVAAFGPEVRGGDGGVDRGVLGRLVFADIERLRMLNALVHPRLVVELRRRLDAIEAAGAPVAVLEAAILLQWSAERLVDLVIGVRAPRDVRLARLVAAGLDPRAAEARVDAQISDEELRRRSDLLIDNAGGPEDLRAEVDRVAAELSRRAVSR